MFGIGWGELALIFIIILVLFGPQKAQGIFKAFGKGLQEFRDAMSSMNTTIQPEPADFQQKKDEKPVEKVQEDPKEQAEKQENTEKKESTEQQENTEKQDIGNSDD